MNESLQSRQYSKRPRDHRLSFGAQMAVFLIQAYQIFISPIKYFLFGPSGGCRFHPTCSCYSKEAFLARGFWSGLFLTIRRISKCHPFNKGGYDPLPVLEISEAKDISRSSNSIIDG